MHYPLIDHVHDDEPISRQYNLITIISCLCIATSITAFTFSDLIIAYSSSPCYRADTRFHPFPIQLWLALSGYMGGILMIGCMFHHTRDATLYSRCIEVMNDTLLLVMFMWNILGVVILCMNYQEYLQCNVVINIYMIIRLSVGMIISCLQQYIGHR